MSKGFSHLDNAGHEGATNTWLTPLSLIQKLGEFDLDPCAFPNHLTAKRLISLPEDGFSADWNGRVWLNPPYGKSISYWLAKLAHHGNGTALVFARTDTKWFHQAAASAGLVYFLSGRIKFLRPDFTADTNAGHGSVLLAWGKENVDAIRNAGLPGLGWGSTGFKVRAKPSDSTSKPE